MTKEEKYSELLKTAESLIDPKAGMIANMSNMAALIHHGFGFLWTGFYLAGGEELLLGPFQGPLACTRIPFGRGVCGTAWKEERIVIVPDVDLFPGHIACSGESRSEIVVPVWNRGKIVAVLDIDSRETGTFDEVDGKYLEYICAWLSCSIDSGLRKYIADKIIPRYDNFDKGHGRDHAENVIRQAMALCVRYDVNPDMVYAAAAYHDTGLCADRKTHHIVSAQIIRSDAVLESWFSRDEIDVIADAAEDHRASLGHAPRTIYGRLIAESDRLIVPETVIRRTVQYGLAHYPELDMEGHYARTVEHIDVKYGDNGYLQLWIPESPNALRLEELRETIRDRSKLRQCFERVYAEEKAELNF